MALKETSVRALTRDCEQGFTATDLNKSRWIFSSEPQTLKSYISETD